MYHRSACAALTVGQREHERLRFKRVLCAYTGISDSSYSRYLNLRRHDTGDMPARVLRAFAGLMGRTMEELWNEVEAGAS